MAPFEPSVTLVPTVCQSVRLSRQPPAPMLHWVGRSARPLIQNNTRTDLRAPRGLERQTRVGSLRATDSYPTARMQPGSDWSMSPVTAKARAREPPQVRLHWHVPQRPLN